MKYVFAWITKNDSVASVFKDVNILMVIQWLQRAWKDVLPLSVKWSFEKCAFHKGDDRLMEADEVDKTKCAPRWNTNNPYHVLSNIEVKKHNFSTQLMD